MDRRQFLQASLVLSGALPLAACTPAPEGEVSTTPTPPSTVQTAPGSRALLAFFSRPGENYHYGDRINLETGNTQVVAQMIAAAIAVDVYRIQAADPYPASYEQTVARNVREEQDNSRPKIANALPNVAKYDTVLLGCPVWNVQAPMIMRTFVEKVDLAEKTIHPFVTFAVSGMGRVRTDYSELLPRTTITEGLAVQGEQAQQAGKDVEAWLSQLGLPAA